MKWRCFVVVCAAAGLLAASPALARSKYRYHHRSYRVSQACAPRPLPFSWTGILLNPKPGPNGCAPPVYAYGQYVGQDPDPFIRLQLRRDPTTGYSTGLAQ